MFLLIAMNDGLSLEYPLISIHLMFLLIQAISDEQLSVISISIHLMFLLIEKSQTAQNAFFAYFNTSHVSINQESEKAAKESQTFQYISCFY